MDFEEKIKQAIERGHRRSEARADAERRQKLSESEVRNRHNQIRLRVSDHIEKAMRRIADHFPGFQTEILYGEKGWGAAITRDDVRGPGKTLFSRLELFVRPLSSLGIVDLVAKGTIRNRELFSRNYYDELESTNVEQLEQLVDTWLLEYAELFAAH
jgi:hypothetical protein